jgi:hypothetical protein
MKTIKQKMMVTVLFCLYLLYSPVKAQQVSFYVQAHEDDWQLFMSKNAIEDIGYAKVVFITLTAGDPILFSKGKRISLFLKICI